MTDHWACFTGGLKPDAWLQADCRSLEAPRDRGDLRVETELNTTNCPCKSPTNLILDLCNIMQQVAGTKYVFCFIPQSARSAKCGQSTTTGDCSFAAVARNLADKRYVNITKILMTFTSTSDLRELGSLIIDGWRLISTTLGNKVYIQFMLRV